MPGVAVVGLQWGDEAKGKVVDILTDRSDIVVRYQGGANAGHTVVFGGEKYKLSLIPSGIFRSEVQSVIAGGVVIDPKPLFDEIDSLTARGVKIDKNLMISDRAHLIFPWHKIEDKILDNANGHEAIGTTMRGIGPCYQDKVGRSLAIRVGDMFKSEFNHRIEFIADMKNRRLGGFVSELGNKYSASDLKAELDARRIIREYASYAERIRPYVCDTTNYLLDAVDADKRILFEGAQGSLLDIDHGTFPFVTSSNSSGVGICSGSGVPPHFISKIFGVVKAYSTRVGGGPFPTEQDNETGEMLRTRGNEYGTVTKRPRRCGWFDAVAVRYASRLGGVDAIGLMLLDVLSGFDILRICTSYNINGRIYNHFPSQTEDLRLAVPNYETLPGWDDDISGVRNYDELPPNAKYYIQRISELVGKKVELISVGADREETICVNYTEAGKAIGFALE
ncbi:MAG: adenylosuccinate synthase [Planctomycetaceae bacterium]|nr:adenylosuccinate synthase [Planctomycetaceae bacterium]